MQDKAYSSQGVRSNSERWTWRRQKNPLCVRSDKKVAYAAMHSLNAQHNHIRLMGGRFQEAIPALFGALFGAGVLGWGAGWISSLTGQTVSN